MFVIFRNSVVEWCFVFVIRSFLHASSDKRQESKTEDRRQQPTETSNFELRLSLIMEQWR